MIGARFFSEEAMPIHDWTRVDAGIFHHFHHGWIEEISRALNRGLLPPDHYALAEQIAGGLGPDVLSLKGPAKGGGSGPESAWCRCSGCLPAQGVLPRPDRD